ncbi:transcriptional regulator ATRX-like protein isoform X2 [Senna tora]|uniref:Transcriptional regulator ATRX-like protein isoform X2 n=1 Tax=Senna tora TaxID=362788 RepID=A0A834WP75_9FABA|nr:transcriptional regulator ATRX-like protein isoform X2 [Senna tora]
MGNRRFTQVDTSDDEDEAPLRSQHQRQQQQQSSASEENRSKLRKRKKMKLPEEEDDERDDEEKKKKRKEKQKEEEGSQSVDEDEEQPQEDAKPIGDPIRVSGKGRGRRKHYESFEFDGNQYTLEDPVLLVPEDKEQKPYVAIIKEITQSQNGSMMVTGQWFYRPEEAERKGGGSWQSRDTRELFYSFHRDEVPAESVMHKCVVHFVPINKQLPNRKQHPGFIVQKVYDTVERKLWKLTDKDYEDNKQQEIDDLVHKTLKRIVDLPDIETEEAPADQEDQMKNKRSFRKRNISPLDVSREDEATPRNEQQLKPETPGSCVNNASEHYQILANLKVLTGDAHRDKWLERLLQSIQYMCNSGDSLQKDDKAKDNSDAINHGSNNGISVTANDCQDKDQKSSKSFIWPDDVVPAIVALEKASHDTLSSDFQKYNQKLRQLVFNLKNKTNLARRLLNGELEPSKILNMSPNELKEGLTAEEIAKKEPDDTQHMQMTDARCSRCTECKVGVRDIIHAGHGDRYQLECTACGNSWYASRDAVSLLTIDGPDSARSVGTAPWATAKFENVEKKLVSPRESDKSAEDIFKKTSEAYMPVLESQKSRAMDLMMVREMKMDLNVKSSEGLSPDTVLPSHQYPLNAKKRHKKGKNFGKDEFLTLTEDFSKIRFARFRSSSCKSILSRPNGMEVNIEMRRGSMYQSSEEVKYRKKMSSMEGRKKIEISRSSNTSFSGSSIVDSLCSSDDEGPKKRSSVKYKKDTNLNSPCISRSSACMDSNFPDGFIEICINPDVRDRYSSATAGRDSITSKARNDKVSNNPFLEKGRVHALHKSFSQKVDLLSPLESDCSSKASPKVQSTPIKKMFNPFTKSKSLTSRMVETSEVKSTGTVNITRNRTYQKSLQNDFSNTAKHSDIISEFINRDIQHSGIASSPVHLHGNLKLENTHGVPSFEFKVKCPEDILVAKKWRADNSAFNWVYTFHSIDGRKKSEANGLGSHDCDTGSSIVAQMLVSCNLCSQLKDGAFDNNNNSVTTEFVLYDLANTRQSVSLQRDSCCDQDDSKTSKASRELDEESFAIKNKLPLELLSGSELHPKHESAAIVLQIPFHKRESLKNTRWNRKSDKAHPGLISHSMVEKRRKSLHDIRSQEQVKVVIPRGNHGPPIAESHGPSRLLDRWRHGGGCDCGGWDMACPLILLGNPGIQFSEDHSLMDNYQPLELFVQGAKQNCPTFSMKVVEEGQYAVDFHAQLSTLQAFSICIAVLHGTCTFHGGAGHEKKQHLSHCGSLKMLIEDEVEFLIDSVPTEKTKSKIPKGNPRPFVINPPFSPIARV